jgi:hypothetical protein
MASSSSAKLPDTPDTSGLGRISKNVLAMGFMRRSAMKLEQQQQQQAASLNNNNSSPINALLFVSSPKFSFSPAAKNNTPVIVNVAGTTRFIKPEDTDDEEEVKTDFSLYF